MSPASTYLATLIARSPKSLGEIADELGYPHTNILSMFKSGHTKIPLKMVGPIAIAVDGDPLLLFRMVVEEHYPDTHERIIGLLGPAGEMTRSRLAFTELYRVVPLECEIEFDRPEVQRQIEDFFRTLADQQAARDQASRDRYDSLPRNGKHRS